jgi:glutathione synthase/RimK-type ligase-like ATP-grasp enzyme
MKILFVVSHVRDWPVRLPGVEVVSARAYLTDSNYCSSPDTKVFNLCNSYRYQRRGYYVSLLAEARGHKPLPDVKAIEDLESDTIIQTLTDSLGELVQTSLDDVEGDSLMLDIHFGRDACHRHEQLCEQLFNLLRVPLLRVRFERQESRWQVRGVRAAALADMGPDELGAVRQAAAECLRGHRQREREPAARRPTLAILHTPGNAGEPSNADALHNFQTAAEQLGMRSEIITKDDAARLPQFDALFIRDTTSVNHYTYQMSRQAAVSGMVVMDDPDSILKCGNKVYLAELLARHDIPTPKTLLVHRDNIADIEPALGLPCILKQPDSAFSIGVSKAGDKRELAETVEAFLAHSELILAQEYLPTAFDWRIGILDRKPLFACKYFMVPGHWQIIQHAPGADGTASFREGMTEAVALGDVPPQVLEVALNAANLIGDGFYGVDLKQHGQHCCVIEINDNPNVDAGNEDALLGDALYRAVIDVFRCRIEARKGRIAA